MLNEILISKNNLLNNVKQVRLNNPHSLICAMVKANAYGVGVREVVSCIDESVDYYGVACFFEAQKLKKLTSKKILIVGAMEKKIDTRYSYACHSVEDVEYLASLNKPINIHLKINTGMNRYGISNLKELIKIFEIINSSQIIFEGVFTHFATADKYVSTQMRRFKRFVSAIHRAGFRPIIHADNSAVNERFNHGLDMVRIGFDLYNKYDFNFAPVVKIESKIAQINNVKRGELIGYDYHAVSTDDMRVAIVPIGYADGFDMRYIGLRLIEKGVQCKVLNICMDCFMLDVTGTDLKKDDSIYILDTINSLRLYADYIHSSEYEVMTKFSYMRARRRVY